MKKIFGFTLIVTLACNLTAQTFKISPSDTSYFYNSSDLKLKNELPDGNYEIYFDEAKTNLAITGKIQNQKRESLWIFYYEDGSKERELNYQNGIPSGELKEFYSNGNLKRSCSFKDGFPTGIYIEWHSEGVKKEEGEFIDGCKIGNWKYWDSSGTLIKETLYEKGAEVDQD